MKKWFCSVLALALWLMAVAAEAEFVPSKNRGDLTRFEVTAENQPADQSLFLRPVDARETEDYQARLDVCRVEIEKLAASPSIEAYFGNVMDMTDGEGRVVPLGELMEESGLNVFEFCPLIAGGFQETCGKVTATMLFATPYEKGERVLVLIGLVTLNEDETQSAEWRAFEGVGLEADPSEVAYTGRVRVELDSETVLAVQRGAALLAVVSGQANEPEEGKLVGRR